MSEPTSTLEPSEHGDEGNSEEVLEQNVAGPLDPSTSIDAPLQQDTSIEAEHQYQQVIEGVYDEWAAHRGIDLHDGGLPESKDEVEETREGPLTGAPPPQYHHQLDVIDSGASSQFARLVRGWETYIDHGTKKVQQGLQNLNICGEGLTTRNRIAGPSGAVPGQDAAEEDEEDLFAPIVLRHTHSSPLNYSSMFPNDPPPATGLEHMRRSSSTPSTSVFRQRSEGSAFGTNLRPMPYLSSGPDDRSAFTLPMQRSITYASVSDSGVRYSAFNPIPLARRDAEQTEKTSIEVTAMGDDPNEAEKSKEESTQKWHGAKKAKQFLKDNVRVLRRRRRRGGRENPAGPSSVSSSSTTKSVEVKVEQGGDDGGTISSQSSDKKLPAKPSLEVADDSLNSKEDRISPDPQPAFPVIREEDEHDDAEEERNHSQENTSHYHQLDSDIDEEYVHYRGIEAIHDSPATVPSPAYQQFVDRGEVPPTATVRIQTSARSPSHASARVSTGSPQPTTVGRTASQDSGAESPGTAVSGLTSNTSGQTTLGTSTSGTVSSGRLTILSAVSETDREVMETNKAGRGLRLESQNRQKNELDGDATIHSSSTTSTATHGYLALGSPASLRDGASMPMDRFFKASRIPIAHNASSNSGSSSSGASGGSGVSATNTRPVEATDMHRMESHLSNSTAHLFARVGETSVGKSVSSGSTSSDDPPKFVSYLDSQEHSKDTSKTIVDRGSTRSSPPVLTSTIQEDRESPAQIVDNYSHVVFEAAKPDSQKLFRPVNKRERRFPNRPPLSPIKGLRGRTPTTPPPHYHQRDQLYSPPAYQQLSPPPNIVDHHILGNPDLSKPYVLRSTAPPPPGPTNRVMLVSPEQVRGGASNPAVPSDDRESSEHDSSPMLDAPHYTDNSSSPTTFFRSQQLLAVVGRNRTYRETSIEVDKDELSKSGSSSPSSSSSGMNTTPAMITPEKSTGGVS